MAFGKRERKHLEEEATGHGLPYMREAIDACMEASRLAEGCTTRLLEEHGTETGTEVRLLLDAADIAQTFALLASRGSPYAKPLGATASDVLTQAARAAEGLGDDRILSEFAEEARRAAEHCGKVAVVR